MNTSTQINHYALESVEVRRNPTVTALIRVTITERDSEATLTAEESVWQEVADKLAAVGIVAAPVSA